MHSIIDSEALRISIKNIIISYNEGKDFIETKSRYREVKSIFKHTYKTELYINTHITCIHKYKTVYYISYNEIIKEPRK